MNYFRKLKKTINNYIEPRKRLIIADRTNFLQLIQNAGESEIDFLARINDSAVYCECPTNYDGSIITTLGIIEAQIETADNFKLVDFVVVNTDKAFGLLGRNVIDQIKSQLHTFAIESRHLPLINNFKAELKLKENYKPLKFCPARKVPIHVKELLDKELKELEAQGIITPIQFSSSCSPVVWV